VRGEATGAISGPWDGHDQGQNLVVLGWLPADHWGADHADVDRGTALCPAKEGAQDQRLVWAR